MTSKADNRPLVNEPAQPDMRSFGALCATMFQGAFNDNAYKFLLMLLASRVAAKTGMVADTYISLAGAALVIPFILFSFPSGQLCDRFSKARVTVWTKLWEVLIMIVGGVALALDRPFLSLGILAMMGLQSTVFSPAKYGMLPEIMPEKKLSWANGWLNGLTFLAIILGTAISGIMYDAFTDRLWMAMVVLAALSAVGLVFSLGIDRLPPAEPTRRLTLFPLSEVKANLREVRDTPGLGWAVVAMSIWWTVAALAQLATVKLGTQTLQLDGKMASLVFICIAVGIGLGSYVAGRISGNKIEVGLVPLGGIGMGLSSCAMAFVPQSLPWMGVALAAMGFFAGWFQIPLVAYIQHHTDPRTRGGVIGTLNFFNFIGIASSAFLYNVMTTKLGFDAPLVYLAAGIFMLFVAGMVIAVIPGAGLRLILFLFANIIYRVKVVGRENVPEKGGALLVCNHLSYADALLVIASLDRPVRSLMFEDIYMHPLVKPFAKLSRAIPVSSRMGPREVIKALRTAAEAVEAGDLLCIFAEGQITRTGSLLPFRKGLERIMKDVTSAPIVPMCLDRVWGSLLSYSGKRWLFKWPKRIPYPVTVSFGSPMPTKSTAPQVRRQVLALATDAWTHRKEDAALLHREAFMMCRRRPFGRFMSDHNNIDGIRRATFLAGTIALARALKSEWRGQHRVGICLPPSIPGAMVNLAALLSGKVPVNLNYTASADVLKEIARVAELETVITSKAFLEKLPLELPGRIIHAEDLRMRISGADRLRAMLAGLFAPVPSIERELGAPRERAIDDTATIIFSSGSTGIPKGVELTHWNLYSNIEGVGQIFSLGRNDGILGTLPFFHSFGTMATLFLPLHLGIRVAYHPNPLDMPAIGAIVERHQLTMAVATPTFLQHYTRKIEPEQLGSLQIVMTGAEKLREQVATAFERKFGVRPVEGYGCTECSPVVCVNTRDFRAAGFFQVGSKPGSIGHPIPGVTLRIVDPTTHEDLPEGTEGLVLVKGPNVMKGYLGQPELTAKVLVDGWYETGDIGRIDEDGFVVITDRLARFSKIGGEMVPHVRIEEALHAALDLSIQSFAVTGIPDGKKGEKLVVLYTIDEADAKRASEALGKLDLPNLWIPKWSDYAKVDEIPVLGTGKMDLRKIRAIAVERMGAAE